MLRIGQVAERSGVGVETVRFYEREGLIASPGRSASGYRQYSASIIEQIHFIQHAKKLGFSLKEISELIALKNVPDARCDGVKAKASAKIIDIQEKIDTLEQMRDALQHLLDRCNSTDQIGDCPILNAFDDASATE